VPVFPTQNLDHAQNGHIGTHHLCVHTTGLGMGVGLRNRCPLYMFGHPRYKKKILCADTWGSTQKKKQPLPHVRGSIQAALSMYTEQGSRNGSPLYMFWHPRYKKKILCADIWGSTQKKKAPLPHVWGSIQAALSLYTERGLRKGSPYLYVLAPAIPKNPPVHGSTISRERVPKRIWTQIEIKLKTDLSKLINCVNPPSKCKSVIVWMYDFFFF
jgi:hypothetical protein